MADLLDDRTIRKLMNVVITVTCSACGVEEDIRYFEFQESVGRHAKCSEVHRAFAEQYASTINPNVERCKELQ